MRLTDMEFLCFQKEEEKGVGVTQNKTHVISDNPVETNLGAMDFFIIYFWEKPNI